MSTLHRVESPASPGDVPKQSLDGGFRPEEYEFDSEATAPHLALTMHFLIVSVNDLRRDIPVCTVGLSRS